MAKRSLRSVPARAAQPSPLSSANPILVRLKSQPDEAALKKLLSVTHPLYKERAEEWRVQLDAHEGSGGFLNGDYLWRYPAEQSDELGPRKENARYHNYARTLVSLYVRHVFRGGVKREAADQGLVDFWTDVDGARTTIDDFMKRGARLALATGHSGVLVDRTTEAPTGPSRADEKARVVATHFPAPTILDWREKFAELTSVKLLEMASTDSVLDAPKEGDEARQYLFWQPDAWARVDHKGEAITASGQSPDATPIGVVPLAIIRPEPSAEHPFIGHSLLGNGNVYKALFNRCSEEDNTLRDQAFSTLVVNVPPEGDVAKAKQEMGNEIGSARALFIKGEADFKTPDMQAPEQVRKNIEFLVKEIYRVAHVRFQRESLDAESAEAVRLQHTELNEMLAALALELKKAETNVARFWFHWMFPNAAQADAAFAKAKVSITYPSEFFITDLLQELEKWAQAIAMDLGLTFEHFAKKRVVDQLAADAAQTDRDAMHQEIETQASAREQAIADAQERFKGTMDRFNQNPAPNPEPAKDQPPARAA